MRMGNPAIRTVVRRAESGSIEVQSPATYGGITLKSIYFSVLTIIAGVFSALLLRYAIAIESEKLLMTLLITVGVCAVVMLILSLVALFAPRSVKVVGSIFALLQGITLGVVVYLVDLFFPGVALAAILGTAIVFVISVALNRLFHVRSTGRVVRVLLVAFMSLIVVQIVMLIYAFVCGMTETFFQAYFWIQLIASAICVLYASVLLMWDLQAASSIVEMGADKSLEWQVAFSLVTTLVYLYLEILELILRFVALFVNNKK